MMAYFKTGRGMVHTTRVLGRLRRNTVYITLASLLVTVVYITTSEGPARVSELHAFNGEDYKQRGPVVPWHNFSVSSPARILIWTTWFSHVWPAPPSIITPRGNKCITTHDKDTLASADAVLFHLYDLTHTLVFNGKMPDTLPIHHHKEQLWILNNLESNNHMYIDARPLNGHFNATWTYANDSEIFAPYGSFKARTKVGPVEPDYDGFSDKTKDGGVALITSCHDPMGRLHIIERMKKIIPIRILGGCGEGCPGDYASCNDEVLHYKFYFALENEHCRDYVTEKYWRPIRSGQVPVVNWRYSMAGLVIPNSYININDFPSVEEAARYIQQVGTNRSLYNSYFKWRHAYEMAGGNPWNDVCELLYARDRHYTTYHDMQGWLESDNCPTVTILGYVMLRIKRWLSFHVFGF